MGHTQERETHTGAEEKLATKPSKPKEVKTSRWGTRKERETHTGAKEKQATKPSKPRGEDE